MCCDSGHKTLPVLTGGAYLHLGPDAPVCDEAAVRSALALFGSTSPSYLILQSLDGCNRALAEEFRPQLAACCAALEALRAELNACAGCEFVLPGQGSAREPLKLTLDAAALGLTGQALADRLRAGAVECEYADPRYVVLMATPWNSAEDLARLRAVLTACCAEAKPGPAPQLPDAGSAFAALESALAEHPPVCSIREAVFAPQQRLLIHEAEGRVCAMPTVSCPPAIPIVVSGETVSPEAVALMERYGIETVAVLEQ